MPTFKIENLTKTFRQLDKDTHVLRDISVIFEQGTSYGLSGISGSGKSTFLQILSGFEKPASGSVTFDNKNIHTFTPEEHEQFLHSSIGILFQTPHLINELSVLENIMLKGLARGLPKKDAISKALMLLTEVMLEHKAAHKPTALSGGEQQRVALARALMNDPLFLLADEPTAHLDMQSRELILKLLQQYKKSRNMGLIVSSHDPYVIQNMDQHYVLENGVLKAYEEDINHQKCC